ncbi:cupin domain-containing protein [Mesorhizobium sp. IMUNJ 23232]|uniref:cupin domain-containing protein n=1 Tax=Mesorhizobium sp. IMUNJ 23232 TaxID=3376064 RepID=UPI0037A9199E
MKDWDKIAAQRPIPGFVGKVMHSDSMSFVLWEISAGALLPEHSHVHEQVVHMLDGEFQLTVGSSTERLSRGQVAAIPSNARHSGRALTDCRILDAFSPVREDYRNGLTSNIISGGAKE